MQSKILIIKGSSRKRGHTQQILEAVLEKVPATLIDLQDYNIGYYDYENKNQGDDFFLVANQLMEYDTILFATPIYWYAMSAILKTFFDRLTDLITIKKEIGRALKGKTMYVIACGSDEQEYEGFLLPFEKTAEYLEMDWGGAVHTWIEEGEIPTSVYQRLGKFIQLIR